VTNAPASKKLYVRFSQPEDAANILAYQQFSAHKSVRKREEKLIRQMAEDGAIVLIEDETGNLVASSCMFPYKKKDAAGVEYVAWQEIGTTRITLNGFPGMFDAMVSMQVLRTFLVEPPAERFVAQMHTVPVQKMAEKLGWRRYTAGDDLIEAKFKTVDASDLPAASRDNWFSAGVEVLPVMAKWMVRAVENPMLVNPRTNEQVELSFERSSFFCMFQAEIKDLSTRDLGNCDTPDYGKGVVASRDRWLKKFFR